MYIFTIKSIYYQILIKVNKIFYHENILLKFGGTSVGTIERIKKVAK